jgi:hypothetical protein
MAYLFWRPALSNLHRIVIVGGRAAGLESVTTLGRKDKRRRADVALIEKNRTHVWKPKLHEIAAGKSRPRSVDPCFRPCGAAGRRCRYGAGIGTAVNVSCVAIRGINRVPCAAAKDGMFSSGLMKRYGTTGEQAAAILFQASDEASCINGPGRGIG